jgi:AGCS family alanine or glycine:cation symporter
VLLFGPKASLVYKIVFIICAFLGSLLSQSNILTFSDLMILSMAFPNILGMFLLSNKIKRALDEYWDKYKRGELEVTRGEDSK